MRRQRTSWIQGWKITLRCTEFNRHDGSKRYVSDAILHNGPSPDSASEHRSDVVARSKIHSDAAFCSCEEAEADAIARAKRQIFESEGEQDFDGSEVIEGLTCVVASSESDDRLAARFEISFDGKRYSFREYRYDQFQDALRYAMTEHAKIGFMRDEVFRPNWAAKYHPSDDEERTMSQYGIAYFDGRFLYGGYRYDQLRDAVAYAAGHPDLQLP